MQTAIMISCSLCLLLLFPDSCMFIKDLVLSYSFIKLSFQSHRGDDLLQKITVKENHAHLIPCNTSEKLYHSTSASFREWTLENV